MKLWKTIKNELINGHNLVLLIVLESKGSSPGRQGFKMAVSQSGLLSGSIGGGIMEHKLVELCKHDLLNAPFKPFIKKQIHQDGIAKDKSGMICSGEQTIAFYHLAMDSIDLVNNIIAAEHSTTKNQLIYTAEEINISPITLLENKYGFDLISENEWLLSEQLVFAPQLHIIGGGHVSLALSRLAKNLEFSVTVYDNRTELNTVELNTYANDKQVIDYSTIGSTISNSAHNYVVILSFGYKTDKIILKSILPYHYKYVGLMGSKEKVSTLFSDLINEGVNPIDLNRIYAPIGINILSKTPEEIAISILAQLISIKNKID